MTDDNRKFCRDVTAFLTPEVAKTGFKKFGSKKFSFENLTRVERDDRIRAENKKSVTQIAIDVKMSRQQMYKVRKRK